MTISDDQSGRNKETKETTSMNNRDQELKAFMEQWRKDQRKNRG